MSDVGAPRFGQQLRRAFNLRSEYGISIADEVAGIYPLVADQDPLFYRTRDEELSSGNFVVASGAAQVADTLLWPSVPGDAFAIEQLTIAANAPATVIWGWHREAVDFAGGGPAGIIFGHNDARAYGVQVAGPAVGNLRMSRRFVTPAVTILDQQLGSVIVPANQALIIPVKIVLYHPINNPLPTGDSLNVVKFVIEGQQASITYVFGVAGYFRRLEPLENL